jgi:hydrogenase large subunit
MSTVVVDPVTRIEGHLRIEAETDGGVITRASCAGTMVRGIEIIMQGRDPRDAWTFTQRICGVCTSSHAISAVRAVEDALDYPIPENARIIRNLINGAQYVHDHVVHFYHLHALDWVDIVTALDADPAVTAELQACISPNHTSDHAGNDVSSAQYFTEVKEKLANFVASGQLGIFANGYWGHPEYRLPAEVNLLAFAHYLEALAWQRRVVRLHTVFGGKNPHPNFVVGGSPSTFREEPGGFVVGAGADLGLVPQVIEEMQRFVDEVYVPDTLVIAGFYKDWFEKGEGVGNFLTFGDFPLTAPGTADSLLNRDIGPDDPDLFIPRGVILNRDLSVVHRLDLDDPEQVQELVSSSWYDYSAGKDTPLHPYEGETTPEYTGPQPPYDLLDVDNAYSWIKSPRWKGQAMEVGPLAHVLMLYATGHEGTQELVNRTLAELKLPLTALYSTMGRVAARTLEAKLIADQMSIWHEQLQTNLVAGDLRTFNDQFFDPTTWPVEARGFGFLEAPRGALGHWVVIENGKITNYQCVVPTTWNAGPRTRDDAGNEVSGAYEASLVGHQLHDPEQPLEILRTIHSFDPCLGCAVHVTDPDGKELVEVKVL